MATENVSEFPLASASSEVVPVPPIFPGYVLPSGNRGQLVSVGEDGGDLNGN